MARLDLRKVLFAALMMSWLPAHAGWELVTRSPRGDLYYLDSNKVQKGRVYQVWSLVDLIEPIEKSSSVKRLYEADCVKGKLRVIQKLVHAGKGGQGALLSSDKKPGDWIYPDPDSVNEELILKICFGNDQAGADAKRAEHARQNKAGHKDDGHKAASH